MTVRNKIPVRLLLADSHVILLDALQRLVESEFTVLDCVTDGRSLVTAAEQWHPDVVLSEVKLPLLNGFEACDHLRKTVPATKTLFLTAHENLVNAREAIRRGAFGFVPKRAGAAELFKAIRTVAGGRLYVSPLISNEPLRIFVSRANTFPHRDRLSFRQREVLQLIAEGKSMKEAADVLKVAERTVAFHKYNIMRQLGLSRSAELLRYAAESDLSLTGRCESHLSC